MAFDTSTLGLGRNRTNALSHTGKFGAVGLEKLLNKYATEIGRARTVKVTKAAVGLRSVRLMAAAITR